MAADTFVVFAASYDTLAEAEADYHAVRELYQASGLINTYDAAVITRDDAGKVSIVAKHEQPTRRGAWRGLGIGLAGGALLALFPAVGLGAGLLLGGTAGAGFGALGRARHRGPAARGPEGSRRAARRWAQRARGRGRQ